MCANKRLMRCSKILGESRDHAWRRAKTRLGRGGRFVSELAATRADELTRMTFFLHLIGDGGGSRTYPRRRDGRQLQIEWKGNYRIDAAAFIFVDRKARGTRTIP